MATALVGRYLLPETIYGSAEQAGIVSLVLAGCISGFAALFTLGAMALPSSKLSNIHVIPYFTSLLVANVIQALATALSGQWVVTGSVTNGGYCAFQGALKNGGNVGMALWSFAMSVHVFALLFLRKDMSRKISVISVAVGWLLVAFVVGIGPIAIQTSAKGPYFGASGYWCWITMYPREQLFMEYFFEFVSAGLSFILYTVILLRVRGNLMLVDGRWSLRFVPRGERWQLAFRRDATDCHMMQVAARMVWHPVAYTVLITPVTVSRFIAFGGYAVPFWATVFSDFVFNLQGVVNVILLVSTRKLIPDTSSLPRFVPRSNVDVSATHGVTPFVLSRSEENEKPRPTLPVSFPERSSSLHAYGHSLRRTDTVSSEDSAWTFAGSVRSLASVNSETPLVR